MGWLVSFIFIKDFTEIINSFFMSAEQPSVADSS